ncbi:NACHT domain-containing protein [Magnetospirillum sp. 64-120]|uniref:NACHT domain-containing protein n=1 Tax=Magnetospirillum sp. 64-120 TaxID=1895778 RepID=UPI0025C0560A|nr:NACHT domain-containing protein [Magnetospirillum sp. 64-120]
MPKVTWLHLSDWHQEGVSFDRDVVQAALIQDIKNRKSIDKKLENVDFVVFSGDAAQNGKQPEFEAIRDHLFAPVLTELGLPPDRLFVVPGNHDLDRDIVKKYYPPGLQKPLTSDQEVQNWLCDDRARAKALEGFGDFDAFFANYTSQANGTYGTVGRPKMASNSKVTIVGFNTAWMCARHEDGNGKVDDRGHLVLGEPQVIAALKEAGESDLHIAVMHHSFEWLSDFDRHRVEKRIKDWADFILWGHAHSPEVNTLDGTAGSCTTIPGGACFGERAATHPRWTNSYNFVHLDRSKGTGIVYLRRWDDCDGKWQPHTISGGRHPLKLAPRLKITGKSRSSKRRPDLAAAEQRYRDLLLETCDILDLANLPEQDRGVVMQRLDIRRLYVPLRVRIEADPEDSKDAAWDAMEQRRTGKHGTSPEEHNATHPVGERLGAAGRLMILGDPGAGKTTLTRWIATAYLLRLKADPALAELPDVATLPEADLLPIVIRCRDLDGKTGTLEQMLTRTLRAAELSTQEAKDVTAFLHRKIKSKSALLILDGLDEISSSGERARLCTQIERIVVAHPELPVIATSRIVGYREMGRRLGRNFEHLTLADFSKDDKDNFATRWCALVERPERKKDATAELIADIHSSDRIERLTGNPMLLTTMALVKRKVGRLPQRRVDLYEQAVGVLLNWRSELDEPLDPKEALPQLRYLAHAMCDEGVQRLPKSEIIKFLTQMRKEYPNLRAVHDRPPEEFLALLESRTGLVMEAGREKYGGRLVPVYEFRHLTFQEFLAASALVEGEFRNRNRSLTLAELIAPLVDRTDQNDFMGGNQIAESWREVLRLCVTLCKSDDVENVLATIQGEASLSRAVLAALCLSDEPNVSDACAEMIISHLLLHADNESIYLSHTDMRRAGEVLAAGRWRDIFKKIALERFFNTKPLMRFNPGGYWSTCAVVKLPINIEKWIDEQIYILQSGDEIDSAAAYLEIMQATYDGNLKDSPQSLIKKLIEAIFAHLASSPPLAHSAAWALAWLAEKKKWIPDQIETNHLQTLISNKSVDLGLARCIIWVIAASGIKTSISADTLIYLAQRLDDADEWIGTAANNSTDEHLFITALQTYIESDDIKSREWAMGYIVHMAPRDERIFLSEEIRSYGPWIDPRTPISATRIKNVAKELEIPREDVIARYKDLSDRFGLGLKLECEGPEAGQAD